MDLIFNFLYYDLMKKIFLITLIILLIACNSSSEKLSNKIYSLEDFPKIGWKKKKSFKTEFPESTDAFWGYMKGHEIGIIIYPDFETASNLGINAAESQIEVVDGKKTLNVERFICRGNTGSIESPSCPNPMPTYSEYVIKNNTVILCEVVKSSMKGSKIKADSESFCENIVKILDQQTE